MTRHKTDLLQGTLDMLILKALAGGALRGYGMEEENWRRLVLAVGKVMQTA